MSDRWGFTTKAIHGGKIDDANKSVAPPIYQTATFYYDTAEEGIRIGQEIPPGYVYTRWANPTTRVLEERVALLEGAEDALALSSGMAAVTTAVMTVLKPGDHAVAPTAIYQASYQLFSEYLGGHHDVTAGVLLGTRDFIQASKRHARIFGTTIDPFGAWLVLRGLATLGLRVERHNQSALALAEFLAGHPHVERVHYPGLPGDRGHELAKRQMRGFGGMLSFEVSGGYGAGVRVLESLRVCKRATSLGGVTTLVSHPAGLSNVHMPKEVREAAGITDGLIRVSVGVEDEADLLADFAQALATV